KESQSSYKNELDAKFSTLPQGMIKLAKLKRDVKINEELYLSVSRKYGEIAVLQQSQSGFGRIVDSGITPKNPVSPNKKIFVLIGLMLGGMLAVGFIAFKEFRDNSVNTVEQLKSDL